MALCFLNWKWLLPVSGILLVAAPAAPAQATMKRGQDILFSTPTGNEIASNAPSLTPRSPLLSDFANPVQLPALNYNSAAQTEPRPATTARVVPSANLRALQKQLDEKKNWALMTPAEILGVPTLEQIMNIPERDAAGERTGQTVLERYYEREENRQNGKTNDAAAYNSSPQWDFPNGLQPALNQNSSAPNTATAGLTFMDQLLKNTPLNSTPAAGGNENLAWPKVFGSPTPVAGSKPTPEQLAAKEQFQKLLEIQSPAATTKMPPANQASSLLQPTLSSTPGQLSVHPAGASFTPLSSGITMPTMAKPLPGLVEPNQNNSPALTPVAPEWKPQLPPWLIQSPEPGVIPQRKF